MKVFKVTLLFLLSFLIFSCGIFDAENSSSKRYASSISSSGGNDKETDEDTDDDGNGVYNVTDPVMSPSGGTYSSSGTSVTITTTTNGASIYYTTNGTSPSCSGLGTLYSSVIPITSTTTIKAIACKNEMDASNIITAVYTISGSGGSAKPATPNFSPVAGTYTGSQTITISCSTGSVQIRYNLNTTAPTCTTGTVYSSSAKPVMSIDGTIKTIACSTSNVSSDVATGSYVIKIAATQVCTGHESSCVSGATCKVPDPDSSCPLLSGYSYVSEECLQPYGTSKYCFLNNAQACTADKQCYTFLCKNSVCSNQVGIGGACTRDHECDPTESSDDCRYCSTVTHTCLKGCSGD